MLIGVTAGLSGPDGTGIADSMTLPDAAVLTAFRAPLASALDAVDWWALYADGQCIEATSGTRRDPAVAAVLSELATADAASGHTTDGQLVLAVADRGLALVAGLAEAAPTPDGWSARLAPLLPALRMALSGHGAAEAEHELDAIYALERRLDESPHGQAGLSLLVGALGRRLGAGYAVLLIPDKRIRIGVTHKQWREVDRGHLDTWLIRQQFHEIARERRLRCVTLMECPPPLDPGNGQCQVLLAPIREASAPVIGVLAVFCQTSRTELVERDGRFAGLVARRVERVIDKNYDRLTGLMNRSGFEAHLRVAASDARESDRIDSVVVFDIDNMQLLNDRFDHRAGDEVLVRFATELVRALPPGGVACRLASDDFAALLPSTCAEDALALAEGLRLAVHRFSGFNGGQAHRVTVSAGVSELAPDDDGCTSALIAPTIACKAAKDHGRDRVEVYDQFDNSFVRRVDDMQVVGQLHSALADGSFALMAQPVAAISGSSPPMHYEILLRMRTADGELLKPAAFFSAAERYQLMPEIDRWVIDSTLAALADNELALAGSGISFAINLSGQSLNDDGLLSYVLQKISHYDVTPACLCFEITETAAVANMKSAQRFIATLRELGCRFSLDDFGVGLSSFGYLKSLDVNHLKIDGSFVRDLTTNKVSESMVRAIAEVARVMELTTIAEYVESDEVRQALEQIGVDFGQGYLIGQPEQLGSVLSSFAVAPKHQHDKRALG